MNLLNACLALALTLGVFASVVTVLVEMLHQAVQQRARDLRGMLGFVFDKSLAEDLGKRGLDVAALRKEFADTLSRDKVLGELVKKHGFVLALVSRRIANASSMTVEDLLRRLPRSGVYDQYIRLLDPEAREKAVKALVARFDGAEAAISEFFRVRAKLLSFLVGACLAVSVNVDAARLFEYFAANPVQTEQAIASLQNMVDGADKTAPAQPAVTLEQRQDIEAMLHRLRDSQVFGLPVGWAYYPYCLPSDGVGQPDPRCREAQTAQPLARPGIRTFLADVHEGGRPYLWFISVLVTGFLIGLGGPYWFDLAMSLSRLRDFLRTGESRTKEKPSAPSAAPEEVVKRFLDGMYKK